MVEQVIHWCPIYAEPKPGSGERITVAIACVGHEAAWVRPLAATCASDYPDLNITLRTLAPLFKGLEAALRQHGERALVGGAKLSGAVVLGEVRRALPMDAERLAELAFRSTAVFSCRKPAQDRSGAKQDGRDHHAGHSERYDAMADLHRVVREAMTVMKIASEDDPKHRGYWRTIIVGENVP